MKTFTRLLTVAAIAAIGFVSCKKGDTGPAGPAGPAGPKGDQGAMGPAGQSGTAGATQFIFSTGVDSGINLTLPSPNNYIPLRLSASNDTLFNAAWFAYLYSQGAFFAIPGVSIADNSTYSLTFVYEDNTGDTADFFIDRVAGLGGKYDAIKLVRIMLDVETSTVNGVTTRSPRKLPDIDFSNYEAVKNYYHLQ